MLVKFDYINYKPRMEISFEEFIKAKNSEEEFRSFYTAVRVFAGSFDIYKKIETELYNMIFKEIKPGNSVIFAGFRALGQDHIRVSIFDGKHDKGILTYE